MGRRGPRGHREDGPSVLKFVLRNSVNLESQLRMVTTSTPLAASQTRFRPARLVLYFLGVILLMLGGGVAGFFFMARSALPQLDGKLRMAGLSAAVTVIGGVHGARTLRASSWVAL